MIKLKQVIHDIKTNSVEATWVNETHPAVDVPERTLPDTQDEVGNIIPGEVIAAHTIPAVQVQVKCHSYADVQMGMFRADLAMLGGYDAELETLIATVEAGIIPYVPPTPTPEQVIAELEATVTPRRLREAILTGDHTFISGIETQIAAERVKIKPKTP